jgi:hypothetical protein
MKTGRQLRCSLGAYQLRYAPSSRLAGGPFLIAALICSSNGQAFCRRFSLGLWAFGAVLQQLAALGVDTDFVCHATILDIEGVA